jgi:hypothetical protein
MPARSLPKMASSEEDTITGNSRLRFSALERALLARIITSLWCAKTCNFSDCPLCLRQAPPQLICFGT